MHARPELPRAVCKYCEFFGVHGTVEQAPVAGLLTMRGAMSLRGLGDGRDLFACLNVAHRLEHTHNISGLL